MAVRFRTKNGVKVRRVQAHRHRWGRVHLMKWVEVRPDCKGWLLACNSAGSVHGRDVSHDEREPVTCRRCLATGLVPDDWKNGRTPCPRNPPPSA